jgi:hypothetical protein
VRSDRAYRGGPVDFFNGYLLAIWEATNERSLYDLLLTLADPTPEGDRHMVTAVSSELVPWLLGRRDANACRNCNDGLTSPSGTPALPS